MEAKLQSYICKQSPGSRQATKLHPNPEVCSDHISHWHPGAWAMENLGLSVSKVGKPKLSVQAKTWHSSLKASGPNFRFLSGQEQRILSLPMQMKCLLGQIKTSCATTNTFQGWHFTERRFEAHSALPFFPSCHSTAALLQKH